MEIKLPFKHTKLPYKNLKKNQQKSLLKNEKTVLNIFDIVPVSIGIALIWQILKVVDNPQYNFTGS